MAFDWNPLSWPSQFFKDTGGEIATGITTGFETVIHDVWNKFILPFGEIGIGVVLVLIAIGLLFKGQILQVAPLVAAAAA